jgi:hypothetical protein
MKTNRGELSPDQSKRNATNAVRCLSMLPATNSVNGLMIDRAVEHCIAGRYKMALDVAHSIDPRDGNHLCPHPLIVAIAEIKNAIRYSGE